MLGLVQVPSTSEAVDGKGVYTVYDIHLNGNYHGSARYSQLLAFHQELKTKFDVRTLEEFPGKHWFSSLSAEQLFARRVGLERYLHSLAQDKLIGCSDLLKEFFIAIQKSSSEVTESADVSIPLEVFLVNGKSVTLQVDPYHRTDQVLEGVASHIKLATHCTYYFNLFLEKQEGEGQTWTVVRPLTDYECPYISLLTHNKSTPHRVTIRKNFWDKAFLPELLADRVARNLLYIECLWSVSSNHWDIPPHTLKQLHSLQKRSQKKEYVELVGSLPQYGFTQLDGFVLDHPEELFSVSVRVGKLEMVTYVIHADSEGGAGSEGGAASSEDDGSALGEDDVKKVFTYPLTKIRSWKVGGKWNTPSPSWKAPWLKFFFQVGPKDFVPVTMQGPQAIFLSNCLHTIVDELLRLRSSQDVRRPSEKGIERELRELPKVVFYEPPQTLQERREGREDEEDIDGDDPAPASPATSTPSSPQEPPATPPTPTNAADTKPHPLQSGSSKPTKSSSRASSTSSDKAEQPALLAKAKQQVMAMMKKEANSPADMENPTFQFGTDDDL